MKEKTQKFKRIKVELDKVCAMNKSCLEGIFFLYFKFKQLYYQL